MLVIELNNNLYLSYDYLRSNGINVRTIDNWRKRLPISILKTNGKSYIDFSYIPTPTKAKLPTEQEIKSLLLDQLKCKEVDSIYKKLKYAQENKFYVHRKFYRSEHGLDHKMSLESSMKHAVWERLMQIYNENCTGDLGGLKKGVLFILFEAYKLIYNDSYGSEQAFSRTIKRVKEDGIDSICIDKRTLGLGNNHRFDVQHEFFLRAAISSGKAYKAPEILKLLKEMCDEAGINCPSISWVKKNKKLLSMQESLHAGRYGADPTEKIQSYAGIISALHADSQYQIDGWDLPFYYLGTDANNSPRLKKLTLIAIKDAYSRKIVGYSIGRSENRLTLFDALEDAVTNTGAMPFELVSDNHSYNQTKEVANFKHELDKIGTTWTVDMNPKRKSITESGFKDFGERFCKRHHGYIGQGIRTKDKDGRTKQEMIDKFQKSGQILSETEIEMIGISAVIEFNKTVLPAKGKSPDQLYSESSKPHRLDIDEFDKLRLFTKKTEYKVSRHQINIVIAGDKYEYQLSSKYAKYNGQTVAVRYESPDLIYLFDLKNDDVICSLKQKEKAHGALADQTSEDIEILYRSASRKKAVTVNAKKDNQDIASKAAEKNPAVYEIANRVLTPKDVLKQYEEDEVYRQAVLRRGINVKEVSTVPKVSELELTELKSAKRSEQEKSPFAPKNHQIKVIDPDEDYL